MNSYIYEKGTLWPHNYESSCDVREVTVTQYYSNSKNIRQQIVDGYVANYDRLVVVSDGSNLGYYDPDLRTVSFEVQWIDYEWELQEEALAYYTLANEKLENFLLAS